jgi:hypothetical protein
VSKAQCRNIFSIKKQGIIIPLKLHNNSITETNDTEFTEMPDKEIKS